MYTINFVTHITPKTPNRKSFEIALSEDLAFIQNHHRSQVLGFEVINCGLTYLANPDDTTSCSISSQIKVIFESNPKLADRKKYKANVCLEYINKQKHFSHAPISYAPGCNINAILKEFA